MKIVADTNTFLAVALREPEKAALTRVVDGHDLIAPEVLPYEIGNALSSLLRRRKLLPDEVFRVWEMVNTIPVTLHGVDIRTALTIAAECGIYAYDAYYLECALRYRAPLLTLDKGMRRAARSMSVELLELPQ